MGLQVTRGDIENVLIHAGILLMIALGILFGRPLLGPTEEAVPVALPAVTPQPGSAPGLATPTAPPPVIDAGQGPGLGGRPLDASGPAAAVPAQESPRSPADSQPAGDPDRPRAVFKYTVEPGDMVSEIADRFGISAETVLRFLP